jgi:predicted AAA+ superfamily ATPase
MKNSAKITKKKRQEYVAGHKSHNELLRSLRLLPISFEEYLNYCSGKSEKFKPRKDNTFTFKGNTAYAIRGEISSKYKSHVSDSKQSVHKNEPKVYTGNLIKGISTLHKSNAVPVISNEELIDHATMRR